MYLCFGHEWKHYQADPIIRARMHLFPILSISSSSLCVFSLCTLWLSGPSGAPRPPSRPATGPLVAEVPLRCCLTCTNTTVCFICLCWFCFTLYGGRPAVGSTRGTLGSGRTPRLAPSHRTNQHRDIFTPLPCCSSAPIYWLCGSF